MTISDIEQLILTFGNDVGNHIYCLSHFPKSQDKFKIYNLIDYRKKIANQYRKFTFGLYDLSSSYKLKCSMCVRGVQFNNVFEKSEEYDKDAFGDFIEHALEMLQEVCVYFEDLGIAVYIESLFARVYLIDESKLELVKKLANDNNLFLYQ